MANNHPIIHHTTTGQTVDVKFYDNTDALINTQSSISETPTSSGRYVVTAATLAAIPLAAADYDVRIEVGGNLARALLLKWNGTTETQVPSLIEAVEVPDNQTHFADGYQSLSVIKVGQNFEGPFKLVPTLSPQAVISSVASCNLTGAASVTGTNPRRTSDHAACLINMPSLTTTGTYTATWTFTTTDSTTVVVTGTVVVY